MARTGVFVIAALSLLAACGREPSPEDAVRAVVAEAEAAAEARDASALFALVADDYRDGRGNGPDEIRRYVRGFLVMHQSVHLLVRIEEIELMATDLARLRATVAMAGREAETASASGLSADLYEFDVTLAREGGDWKVTRAEWRRGLDR